jgi:hypothetical protein
VNYQALVADKGSKNDNADLERLVLYFGYKFNDPIILNSEIEFEHSSTSKSGSVSVETKAVRIDSTASVKIFVLCCNSATSASVFCCDSAISISVCGSALPSSFAQTQYKFLQFIDTPST